MKFSKRLIATALAALVLPAAAARAETTVLKNFTLIDGTGRRPVSGAAMVIQDGRVQWVGPAAKLKVPSGAQALDLGGKYVIPGLIDDHVHLALVNGLKQDLRYYTRQNLDAQLKIYAAYGITSVQVLGTDKDMIYDLVREQHARQPAEARVFTAGRGVVFQGSYGGIAGLPQSVSTPDEARRMVDRQVANGADLIKLWMDDELGTIKVRMPYAVSKAVIDEGHKHHLKVVAHVFYLDNAKELVREGIDGFAHEVRDQPVDQALVDGMKARGTWQMAATLSREASFIYSRLPFLNDPFFSRGVTPDVLAELASPARQQKLAGGPHFKQYGPIFDRAMANFRNEAAAGVKYGMGTDSGPTGRFPGYFAHWEMQLMVRAGLTPMQALTAATRDNAVFMGAKDLGTLEPGKQADLVVLDKDPLADIANTRTIRAVYIAGRAAPTIWSTCVGRPATACTGGPDTAPVMSGGVK
ncbi:MAG: amidohydrolase family protein [Caulobacteraceae bacterium]